MREVTVQLFYGNHFQVTAVMFDRDSGWAFWGMSQRSHNALRQA